jgi:hypothetical protein
LQLPAAALIIPAAPARRAKRLLLQPMPMLMMMHAQAPGGPH